MKEILSWARNQWLCLWSITFKLFS